MTTKTAEDIGHRQQHYYFQWHQHMKYTPPHSSITSHWLQLTPSTTQFKRKSPTSLYINSSFQPFWCSIWKAWPHAIAHRNIRLLEAQASHKLRTLPQVAQKTLTV